MSQKPQDVANSLYDRLLGIGHEAIDAGLFETAFHALSAALHCAELLDDPVRVASIRALAVDTRERIDNEYPNHRISSSSASGRGQKSVFATLVVHSDSVAARIRGADALKRADVLSQPEELNDGHPGSPHGSKEGGSTPHRE